MTDLAMLLGELKQFREQSTERHEAVLERLDELEEKMDAITQLRWRVAGGVAAISAVLGFVKLMHELK